MAIDLSDVPGFAWLAYAALTGLIAVPSLAALHGRRRSRECSELAASLADYAAALRNERCGVDIDEALLIRARQLAVPELLAFEYLRGLTRPDPVLLADAAQRLALRLKRRVAFARKMLARTASGRRRAALAAALPALVMVVLGASGVGLPAGALVPLLLLESVGCWLLWCLARVEV